MATRAVLAVLVLLVAHAHAQTGTLPCFAGVACAGEHGRAAMPLRLIATCSPPPSLALCAADDHVCKDFDANKLE
jgi:hypothetical protein